MLTGTLTICLVAVVGMLIRTIIKRRQTERKTKWWKENYFSLVESMENESKLRWAKFAEKDKLIDVVAKVQLASSEPTCVYDSHVWFTIRPRLGTTDGEKFDVFDYRFSTVLAAKRDKAHETKSYRDFRKLQRNLEQALQLPARVIVTKGLRSGNTINPLCVCLYPADNQKPTALLSETAYVSDRKNYFRIVKNDALWNHKSELSFHFEERSGGKTQMIHLLTLTDNNHRVIGMCHKNLEWYRYDGKRHGEKYREVISAGIERGKSFPSVTD